MSKKILISFLSSSSRAFAIMSFGGLSDYFFWEIQSKSSWTTKDCSCGIIVMICVDLPKTRSDKISSSLLDNAPNYLLGCVFQKRTYIWHQIVFLLIYFFVECKKPVNPKIMHPIHHHYRKSYSCVLNSRLRYELQEIEEEIVVVLFHEDSGGEVSHSICSDHYYTTR